ncbi:hypothetical protein B0H14DRAFT_3421462 [Mycena olivaceomarginata]|nr:hypothetical protein B0H14DRAFT_3421462 [Mycena olivaceomarginata]
MTTRIQTSGPFSKLSLVAKGAQSPPPHARNSAKRTTGDDDYIPYNGPYEEPPRAPKARNRDSWGDPLYDEDGNNMIQELHQRYAPSDQGHHPWHDEEEERRSRPRARTHSGFSGHTVSSGAVDPHRSVASGMLRKASHHANVARPPVPSYINLDAAGGVGESPAPPSRFSREIAPPKRSSLASIFTFGQRKLPLSPAKVALPTSPPATSPPATRYVPRIYEPTRTTRLWAPFDIQHGDAYHSYYTSADQFGHSTNPHNATPPPQLHPYAYNQPQRDIYEPPQTAPITSPKLQFASPPPHRHALPSQQVQQYQNPPISATPRLLQTLKTYASTPNLRPHSFSPPGSPVFGGFNNPDRPEGMASRVLAHSRSMASLKSNAEAGPSRLRNDGVVKATTMREAPIAAMPLPQLVLPPTERPPRPKSFAWDDLALPSPVPSLARVLEEGQILEHQRKKMADAGDGVRGKAGRGGNVEYLAARSMVGNQDVVPVLPRRHARSTSQGGTNTVGTTTFNTRTSHSHSNSLVKTTSKSSLSQSYGHSRNNSWTRTAIKKAAALCYDDNISPADEKAGGLETAIRGVGTKVIRLADPAQLLVDMSGPLSALSPRNDVSPVPSGTSDHMGIAISTPPNDNNSDRDSIHLLSHPYAQGGVSFPHRTAAPVTKGADYAGPHPAAPVVISDPNDFSARHRLPPQAQAALAYHPYAQPSSRRDSYQIPGVVREILPGELLYSPFMSERSTTPDEDREERGVYDAYGRHRKSTATILDTVGLGETLAYAVEEEKNQRDSGLGTSEDHPVNEEAQAEEEWADDGEAAAVEGHHPYRIHRKPVQYDIALSRPSYATPQKSGIVEINQGDQPYGRVVASGTYSKQSQPSAHAADATTASQPHGALMTSMSSAISFYKPNLTDEVLNNLSRPVSGRQPSITWDMASTTRTHRTRTGSGLTSLARQLSQEFEELRAIRQERSGSIDSESSISRFSRFPTENDIHFSHLPEDVVSSRASSPGIEGSMGHEDEHEPFRVGSIEAVATPPATSADIHRSSFTGQLSFVGDLHDEPESIPKGAIPIPRAVSSLHPPPSADPTRSSYMTESTVSRMSNLSDFPVPPAQPAHMSLLSSYFHGRESEAQRALPEDSQSVSTFKPRIGEKF